MSEAENETMKKRLNDLEQNSLPSLRKALRDVAMEKDVAVIAREEFSTQLRMAKKRLKEAEEEQYITEEDATALREELNSLQQHTIMNPFGDTLWVKDCLNQNKELRGLLDKLRTERAYMQPLYATRAQAGSVEAEKDFI
ncbi:hypothetical protein GIB67_038742 [Kingdonia uniflora]|uniref:Uncharacterized protein n=1 Tax=Kingdonia uniflora TaxID=39325 RepID=A0A7J7NSS2_9MAGN|nr:hypothetical protein GIB67_038742 [Kingdonia uniflora]